MTEPSPTPREHPPGELPIGPHLAALLDRCQTQCVAECCGLDAFDLSPLPIAAALTRYGGLDETEMAELRGELADLERTADAPADADGLVGCSDRLNQCLTAAGVRDLVAAIRRGIDGAGEMVDLSNRLAQR